MRKYWILFIVLIAAMAMSCGGSKQTANLEAIDVSDLLQAPDEREAAQPVTPEATRQQQTQPATRQTPREPLIFKTVYFEFDKSDLTRDSRRILAAHANKLKFNPDVKLLIEGHCDERGTIEYNLALGERRAIAVRDYLVNYGISRSRLVDPGHTEGAWAKNRRAVFRIVNQ